MPKKYFLLSAALGAISVFAFAPFEAFPLIFVCLAGLIELLTRSTAKQAALHGLAFGLGLYLVGVSWVYISLSTYGGMPLWMGSIAVLGFASIMACFTSLACWLAVKLAVDRKPLILIALPFSWVVLEWCKSWVLTGFPWLDMGYTQTPSWLLALAPVGGVYLVSFAVVVISVLLVQARQNRSFKPLVIIIAVVSFSFAINAMRWTEKTGAPIHIGIVQANVAIETKWQEQSRRRTIEQYRDLSAALAHEASQSSSLDLLVWPETALALYASQTDEAFWQAMTPKDVAVLAGLLDHDDNHSYNAAALSCPNERAEPQIYRKRHLVPFGEYQPLQFLFAWVFEYLQLPMSDFVGWQGQQPLQCSERLKIALSICYEDAFSNEYRAHLGDATLLVNISEDAWFGDSFAPHQRVQLAQMRARELGRPLVRAANSGPSLFIDEFGTVIKDTEQFQVAVASAQIQPMEGKTPFVRWGSWIVWLSILVLSGMFLRSFKLRN